MTRPFLLVKAVVLARTYCFKIIEYIIYEKTACCQNQCFLRYLLSHFATLQVLIVISITYYQHEAVNRMSNEATSCERSNGPVIGIVL